MEALQSHKLRLETQAPGSGPAPSRPSGRLRSYILGGAGRRGGLPESCEQLKPVSPVLLLFPRGCLPAMSAVRCGDRPRSERQSPAWGPLSRPLDSIPAAPTGLSPTPWSVFLQNVFSAQGTAGSP